MSIAAPPQPSCSTTHFRYEKGLFYEIRFRVLEQRACSQFRGTQGLFSLKYLFGEAKIARIFYSLRKARNFYMTVPVVYNFWSLSNKIPTTLPRCHLGGFLVISFIFSLQFCFSFLFLPLNSQRGIKIYSWRGIIFLWSASPFVCDINLIYYSCGGIDTFGRNWRYPYCASRFRKTAAGGIIFSSNQSHYRQIIFNYLVSQSACCWEPVCSK